MIHIFIKDSTLHSGVQCVADDFKELSSSRPAEMSVSRQDEGREGELRGESPGGQENLPEKEGVRQREQHPSVAHLGQEGQEPQQLGADVGVAVEDQAEVVHGPG